MGHHQVNMNSNEYPTEAMEVDEPLTNGVKQANEWPDAPLDRNDFYRDLQAVHYSRGTNLDPNPRVHGKPIDLYDLFYNIEGRGGYDKVSAEKLLWRKIAAEFNLAANHAAASAFQIKTVYYKNLAAYAIKRVHKQEPPPKEILEDLTAKGSDLLSRTVHNFKTPRKHDPIPNGHTPTALLDDDGSGSEGRGTPGGDIDGAYGSGRGLLQQTINNQTLTQEAALRQAPPQRVFFQPDMTSTRRPQQTPQMAMPMQPSQTIGGFSTTNAALNSNGTSFVASKYESRAFPLSFRPVPTASNSPVEFHEKLRRVKASQLASVGRLPPPKPQFMAPGSTYDPALMSQALNSSTAGFSGPNVYLRVLMALRSEVLEEQRFALTHLVKISHERGDKFKFEAFIGFAEGLIEKSLEIASLFYNTKWQVSYTKGDELDQDNVLDGIDATSDLLERIARLEEKHQDDGLETRQFCEALQNCVEAILVLRNMSMLPENARYLAEEQVVVKDLLIILLNLPNRPCLVEVKNDALDIAEQLTEYWELEGEDPLYTTLLKYLEQKEDRGAATSALRAMCRISLQLEETNKLPNISLDTLHTMTQWCTLEDEDLSGACLDFFYQYTALPENVSMMLRAHKQSKVDLRSFIHQLARLLLYDARESKSVRETEPATTVPGATEIPVVPQDLLEQMINIPEPERSSAWLRAVFEEDKDSEMTQISLWQSYQNRFQYFSNNTSKPMLAAADFIKRISETFKNTSAQVLQTQSPPKFIIKGIRPRKAPMDLKGFHYAPCLWAETSSTLCNQWVMDSEKMYEHILKVHLGVAKDSDGIWDVRTASKQLKDGKKKLSCSWAGCQHFAKTNGSDSIVEVGLHIKTHLPDTGEDAEDRAQHNVSKKRRIDSGPIDRLVGAHIDKPEAAKFQEFIWKNTASRDLPHGRIEAEGLSLSAILVLRNLARSIAKVGGPNSSGSTEYWIGILFKPIMNQLWHVASTNLSMTGNIYDLLETIDKVDE